MKCILLSSSFLSFFEGWVGGCVGDLAANGAVLCCVTDVTEKLDMTTTLQLMGCLCVMVSFSRELTSL